MTGWRKRQVSEMAKEAGLRDWTCNGKYGCLGRFVELVRADEREQIAQWYDTTGQDLMRHEVPDAIRARGQA